mmetsp:Transcript_19884/g.37387  ORF Transcript_19884/g.37387 Transcript_19884/m.37387 type:complete len:225 (+) Transcript_19884:37-711(+)
MHQEADDGALPPSHHAFIHRRHMQLGAITTYLLLICSYCLHVARERRSKFLVVDRSQTACDDGHGDERPVVEPRHHDGHQREHRCKKSGANVAREIDQRAEDGDGVNDGHERLPCHADSKPHQSESDQPQDDAKPPLRFHLRVQDLLECLLSVFVCPHTSSCRIVHPLRQLTTRTLTGEDGDLLGTRHFVDNTCIADLELGRCARVSVAVVLEVLRGYRVVGDN